MTDDLDAALAELELKRPGWIGAFVTSSAPGAIPAGARVWKVSDEPGDLNPVGTLGTVLGSLEHPTLGIAYFVEWDNRLRCAVLVIAWKVRELA